jgi:hypothetical protein
LTHNINLRILPLLIEVELLIAEEDVSRFGKDQKNGEAEWIAISDP